MSVNRPTDFYLVYPLEWEEQVNNTVVRPIIKGDTGYNIGYYPDDTTPIVTVDGRDYRVINIRLSGDVYTITF